MLDAETADVGEGYRVDDEQDWDRPRHHGWPFVVAILAVSASITVLLLLPIADGSRRWGVAGLLAVLVVLQGVLGVQRWRAGWRPVSPRWLRIPGTVGWTWGSFSALTYVTGLGHQSALDSAVSGEVFAAMFCAATMWFLDPARASREKARTGPGETRQL